MCETKRHDAILLSIHPQYAEAILDGSKTVEFRKKNIPLHLRHVVLYATSPVCRVVGYFSVAEIVTASPSQVWRRFNGAGGISHDKFARYYAGDDIAKAMVIEASSRLLREMKLEALDGEPRPPHSFRYLASKPLKRIVNRKVRI